MLGKLFKYDMKALARVLVPLNLAVVVVAVVATVAGLVGYNVGASHAAYSSATPLETTLSAVAVLVVALGMFTMLAAPVATLVVVIQRFYKNLFTDEGYLSFTLPVSANQHMLSKALAGLLWMLVDLAVVGLGLLLASFGANGFVDATVDSSIPYWLLSASGGTLFGGDAGDAFTGMANTLVQVVLALSVAYAAFAVGASMAQRHKVAAGVGMYLLIMWLYGLVAGIVAVVVASAFSFSFDSYDYSVAATVVSVVNWVVSLGVAAGCYALCVHLLGRRLNLV